MYLTENDYKRLIYDEDLEVVEQATESIRQAAEKSAEAYFKGFLRGRYDVDALFELTGDDRNDELIMFMIDEVLFTLHSSLPGNLMPEIRMIRKENVDKWLEKIQKGIIQPDFPTIDDEDETDQGNPVKHGSNSKLGSTW